MKLALCIPTRGLIFAETIITALLSPDLPEDTQRIIVNGLKIPDSHTSCVERALALDCTHILFVEEDMVIPPGGIAALLMESTCGAPCVAIDYPVTESARTTIQYADNKPLWTGFGCILIASWVFAKLPKPWFRTDYTLKIKSYIPFRYDEVHIPDRVDRAYGQFDIWFGVQMKKAGIPITVIPNMQCTHLRADELTRKNVNDGVYSIRAI